MGPQVDYRTSAHETLRRTFVAHNFGWVLASLSTGALLCAAGVLALGPSSDLVVAPAFCAVLLGTLAFVVFARVRFDVELHAGEIRLRARSLLRLPVDSVVSREAFRGFAVVDVARGRRQFLAVRFLEYPPRSASDALEMRRDRLERTVREMNEWVRTAA